MTVTFTALTPLERLHLREVLQDDWRDQVRRITELSLDLYTAPGSDDDREIDPADVAIALSGARLQLDEIEQAMRRLDDRTYGSCLACFTRIPFDALISRPESRYCAECSRSAGHSRAASVARAG